MSSSVVSFRRGISARAAWAAAAVFLPALAEPCSICRCGDATFNALGKDGYAAQGWRLAADWERFDKEEGDPAEESEAQVENRFTALVSYGLRERFTLLARLPVSVRDLEASFPRKIRAWWMRNGSRQGEGSKTGKGHSLGDGPVAARHPRPSQS